MRSTWRSWGLPVLVLLAASPPLHAQSFGFPWWRDAQFQHDLLLSSEQTARIENIFHSSITDLRAKKAELDQQEEELSRLIAANADEQAVVKQVDRVEAIRSQLNKMRTLMLLHIRQVLTPDQRVKLNKMHEHWERDHGRGRGANRNPGEKHR